jgi:hypothetical protein
VEALFVLLVACGGVAAVLAAGAVVVLRHRGPSLPGAGEARDRLALRLGARFDRTAARELRRRLRDELRRHAAVRKHLEANGGQGRDVAALLQAVDRAEQVARSQLADVETWLGHSG